jgi:uncharacterized oxidoreductase
MKLKNKTILITGGSSGIGLEAVAHCLNEGMKVIVCGRNTAKNNLVRQKYKTVTVIDCDITDENEVYLMYQLIAGAGGIDILYNNAAVINMYGLLTDNKNTVTFAADEMAVNYTAVIRLNSLFMDMLLMREEAAIIHTTSAAATVPVSFIATYCSSKAALQSYTVSLRHELKKAVSRIKVFELIPPVTDTEAVKEFKGKKVSTSTVVKALIKGLKNDTLTIRVTVAKLLYYINRFFPGAAHKMINQ